jgi:hypothetical protein
MDLNGDVLFDCANAMVGGIEAKRVCSIIVILSKSAVTFNATNKMIMT